MRILIWTDAFWPEIGGLELFCMRLAEAWQERGHACAVITDRRTTDQLNTLSYRGIPVHETSFEPALRGADLPRLRRQHEACSRLIDEFRPDVIHLNSVLRGAIGFLLQQRRRRRPAVLTLHDHALSLHAKGTGPELVRSADVITAISQSQRKFILGCEPGMGDRTRVILNALPAPALAPAPYPPHPRLLVIGRLVREKGFDLAIRAFAALAPKFPPLTLTVVGEGTEAGALRRLAQETGFPARIHFRGWIDLEEIPAVINEHSLVVMPSRWEEPFGLVALQAAHMARPIVAARTGALPEIVLAGVTGSLVPNEDLSAYTAALHCFLEDPGLIEKMGRQAREHVENHFSFRHFIANYENAYHDAVKNRAAGQIAGIISSP
jgi:glycogen(starch) synthase